MAEKYQNDLMHLQNDILIDLKNVETNMDKKIKKLNLTIEQKRSELEKKLDYLENAYTVLLQRTQNIKVTDNSNEKEIILAKIDAINKKLEDRYFNLENKCYSLRTDLKDSCFKYDRILEENFNIPGLIGFQAPFSNFRSFMENIYKKLNESLKTKDSNVSEFKKYREKLDKTININKNHFSLLENRLNTDFKKLVMNLEKKNDDKFNIFEEKINNIEIENEKKSTDLIKQCNDLNNKINQIDSSLKYTSDNFNDELYNYKNEVKEIKDKFENNYKSFEEKLKIIINEEFDRNNKNNINFTNLETKIKELENLCLSMKSDNNMSTVEIEKKKPKQLDYSENIELSKFNFIELNKEEDDKNSLFSKRLNKLFQNNNNNINKEKNNSNSKIEQKTVSARNYSKKTDLYNSVDKDDNEKKSTLYDSGYLKHPKNLKGILNSPNKIKKTRDLYKRITSGKIFNKFPFISYNRNGDNEDIKHSLSRNKINNFYREKIKSKDISMKKGDEKDNSMKKKGEEKDMAELIFNSRYLKKKQIENESVTKDKNSLSIYRYKYLEKKIDILGKVMIENLNKIILHMKFFTIKNGEFQDSLAISPKEESKKYNDNTPFFKVIKLKDNNILEENFNFRNLSRGKTSISPDLKKSDTFYQKEDSNSFLKSKSNQNFKFFKNETKKSNKI